MTGGLVLASTVGCGVRFGEEQPATGGVSTSGPRLGCGVRLGKEQPATGGGLHLGSALGCGVASGKSSRRREAVSTSGPLSGAASASGKSSRRREAVSTSGPRSGAASASGRSSRRREAVSPGPPGAASACEKSSRRREVPPRVRSRGAGLGCRGFARFASAPHPHLLLHAPIWASERHLGRRSDLESDIPPAEGPSKQRPSHDDHVRAAQRVSAAATVCSTRTATVTGPTPPGTGVAAATSTALGKTRLVRTLGVVGADPTDQGAQHRDTPSPTRSGAN